jgi:preprotein translocase subunit SecF
LIGGSIAIFALRGERNFGIDFRGGDLLVVDSKQPLTIAEAREALEGIGLGDVVIQFEREGMQDRLSTRSPQGTSAKILSKLQETYRNRDVTAVAQENVGPQIGLEFAKRAALALALGMVGILIYVTFRFECFP